MTQRHLLAVLISAALLLPGQAASAADDDMLRAFSEAARTLPPAPAAKPQPPAKLAAKPAAKTVSRAEKKAATAPDHSAELTRLRARVAELEKLSAAPAVKADDVLKAQLAASDKKLAALSAEKQQQEKNIATLQQALKEAQQQQSTGSAQLMKQLNDARAAATQSADALKALKAENDKALAALQAESKKQLSAQQAESAQKLAAQQTSSDKQLKALQSQQTESEKKLTALQTQQAEREKQLAALDSEKQQQAHNLAQLTRELEAAKQQPAAAPKLSAPKSDAERDGYTLGQFIASNAVVQLQMVKDIGLSISMDQLIAGLTTQLQSGDSLLDGEEMARRYATMQASIGKGLNALIEKGYAQLDKKVAKRKALKKDLGMQWFAVKSVKGKLLPDQQAAVSVRVTTLSGKVINDFSHDQVPFNDSLPPLLQEGMSLTGKGGAVEGWALAKDIYEREPLPPWVAPYDVIHYQLTIK